MRWSRRRCGWEEEVGRERRVLAAEAAEDLRQMEHRVAKTHSPGAKHSSPQKVSTGCHRFT